MPKLQLNSVGTLIEVDSNSHEVIDFIKEQSPAFIPDVIFSNIHHVKAEPIISVIKSDKNMFKIENGKQYLIEGNYNINKLAQDALVLSSRVFEDSFIEKNMYSFHSSAISNGKKAIIISGFSSAGKTTVAINSCLKNKDEIKFYSGDRTVLHGSNIKSGTKKTHLRLGSVFYEIPELQEYIHLKKTDAPWEEMMLIDSSMIDINPDSGTKEIKYIIYPKKGDHELKVNEIKGDEAILRIHENICYFSDYYPHIILGQKEPLQSNISYEQRKERVDYVSYLSEKVPILSISGNLNDITDYASKLMLNE